MIAGLAAALAVAAAAPAIVGRGALMDGPVMAGRGAAWADRTPSGAVRVVTSSAPGGAVVRRRWGAPRAAATTRSIDALAADGRRGAVIVDTCTRHRTPFFAMPCAPRAFAGPFARLRGPRLPARVPRRCPAGAPNARAVAAGGGWTAVLLDPYCPDHAAVSATRTRIVARRGRSRVVIPVTGGTYDLSLAGRYLAWGENGRGVLYDLASRRRVRLVRRWVSAVNVQSDGTLAVIRLGSHQQCMSVLPLHGVGRRLGCESAPGGEARAASGPGSDDSPEQIAIAAGRVLYVRYGVALVLAVPGRAPRVLRRFSPQDVRVGELDLGPHGATWAEQRRHYPPGPDGTPRGFVDDGKPRVMLRRL